MAKKERTPLGRGKSLDEALKNIQKSRELRIASLGDLGLEVEAVTTGNIAIDEILGVGGLPKGRIMEFYGPPSSGKTTCALQAAAAFQKSETGKSLLFLDYEYALDPAYCAALGLDITAPTFLTGQPETFEQGMNSLRELIETGEVGFVIVDSVAAMAIEKEMEIETGGSTFADKAKLMAQTMRQLTPIVKKHDVVCIFLNHVRDVIDSSPMGQRLSAQGIKRKTTPGGEALKFHASVRIEFKQVGNVRDKEENALTNEVEDVVKQTKVKVTTVKNKVAPPYRDCEIRVRYGQGFSQAYSVFKILVDHKAVKKGTGGVYTFPEALRKDEDTATIRGETNAVHEIETNPEWLEKLRAHAQELLDAKRAESPAPVADDDDVDVDGLLGTDPVDFDPTK